MSNTNTWDDILEQTDILSDAEEVDQKARAEWRVQWIAAKKAHVGGGDTTQAWKAESEAWSKWHIAMNEVAYRRSILRHTTIHHWKLKQTGEQS